MLTACEAEKNATMTVAPSNDLILNRPGEAFEQMFLEAIYFGLLVVARDQSKIIQRARDEHMFKSGIRQP